LLPSLSSTPPSTVSSWQPSLLRKKSHPKEEEVSESEEEEEEEEISESEEKELEEEEKVSSEPSNHGSEK
jgi:hypothetical protein